MDYVIRFACLYCFTEIFFRPFSECFCSHLALSVFPFGQPGSLGNIYCLAVGSFFCFAVQDVHFFCAYSLMLEAALSFMKRKSYKIRPRVRTFEASCAGVFLPIRRQQNSPSGYSIGRAEMLFYFAAVLMNKRCSAVTSLKRAKISFIIRKHTRVRLIWSEGSF